MSGPPDAETLAFYDREAETYAGYVASEGREKWLDVFAARLAPGSKVLDLGCGSGWAAARLGALGHRVRAIDASAGLAAEARRLYGIEVEVAPFDALDAEAAFDAVWASFSLLHDTRAAMPGHLGRIARALRPGGLLYLGVKEGTGEARDRHGRRYTYFGEAELAGMLAAAGFAGVETTLEHGASYTGEAERFLHILATGPGEGGGA